MIQDQVFNHLLMSLRESEARVLEALATKSFESRYELGQVQGRLQGLREARAILIEALEEFDK